MTFQETDCGIIFKISFCRQKTFSLFPFSIQKSALALVLITPENRTIPILNRAKRLERKMILFWTFFRPISDLFRTFFGPSVDLFRTFYGPSVDLFGPFSDLLYIWTFCGPLLDLFRTIFGPFTDL